MNQSRRIIVIGNAGAGKTTVAKLISRKLDIPFYSLDKVVWLPNWKVTPLIERKQLIYNLINKDMWVIDGVSFDVLNAADIIVFLDIPRYICYTRLFFRNLRYLFKSRPELPKNCPEIKIIGVLIRIVWKFNSQVRPSILEYKDRLDKKFYHIRSSDEIQNLYEGL